MLDMPITHVADAFVAPATAYFAVPLDSFAHPQISRLSDDDGGIYRVWGDGEDVVCWVRVVA